MIFFRLVLVMGMAGSMAWAGNDKAVSKLTSEQALVKLQEGNSRFVRGKSAQPNSDARRRLQAAASNQAKYAYATILSCSDSRVPAERIFDAGIMDVFVVRMPGNVGRASEAGAIEYGVAHVQTPLVVVLGHSDCGAVKTAVAINEGARPRLEKNIYSFLKPIAPAVKKAKSQGSLTIENATQENVRTQIANLLRISPDLRQAVADKKVKIVGAIYNIGTGKVEWLKP